jgi:hypothetical protein
MSGIGAPWDLFGNQNKIDFLHPARRRCPMVWRGRYVKSGKKKYIPPQFKNTRLTPEQARAMFTARGLPDSPVVKQLLEWVAELESRLPDKK